jgi:hypothetical protein
MSDSIKDLGPRLDGCRAYPGGKVPVTWCKENQGEWCGRCKNRRVKRGGVLQVRDGVVGTVAA